MDAADFSFGPLSGQLDQLPPTDCQEKMLADGNRSSEGELKPKSLPELGSEFLGFEILARIGAGAFGKVYLARQNSLGGRLVVLKITKESAGEARVLAQLLHTNVVPIYSVHHESGLTVVCMPYLGTTTLADVLKEVHTYGLPGSGKYLVDTLQEHRSTRRSGPAGSRRSRSSSKATTASTPSQGSGPEDVLAVPGLALEHPPGTRVILDKLRGLTYENAVLWIAARLADGLAHAHERGILHRDLKPANILLTDEGQPMLLDFNLAEDTKLRSSAEAARLGGTLPYMAPEQMAAFLETRKPLGPGCDIYALGIILFELLTGRFPFPQHCGPTRDVLKKMVQDRQQTPPRLRTWNKAVTPAVEAIVRRCLEPDPANRYQTSRNLLEDLRRQRDDLPLRHVPEPSWRERGQKWVRRHPRLTSWTSVMVLTSLIVAGLVTSLLGGMQRLRSYEAAESLQRFEADLDDVHFLLADSSPDRQRLAEPLERGRQLLARYEVMDNPDWRELPLVSHLDAAQRDKLENGVRVLLMLLARGELQTAEPTPGDRRSADLRQALAMNDKAGECGAAAHLPRAWWLQRAELLALFGNQAEADKARDKAGQAAPGNLEDRLLTAREHLVHGRFEKALPILQEATRQDPQQVHAWFLLGKCHDGLGQDDAAAGCYTTCIALRPKESQPYFQRGVANLRQRAFARAHADFERVIELQQKNYDAYFNRALASNGLKKPREAVNDLNEALKQGAPYTRVYFLRARMLEQVGDADGAKRDLAEGLKLEPGDDLSWNARGYARLASDPKGALADFRKALAINERSLPALENIAHVLADIEKKPTDAVPFLDKAVSLYPDYAPSRTGRGLLLARLGKRDAALVDAREVLKRRSDAATSFRVAGIYAQTSRQNADDAKESLRLLTAALRQGYGFELVERDPDLEPLHNLPHFKRLVTAVMALQSP
jgi:serine/threonine protein kinase/Tfp pilus assembly protein PilF